MVYIFNIWFGPTSVTAWMQRRQKNWFKYTDFTELKKITSRIDSNTSNFSSFFFQTIKFFAACFVSLKNNLQLTAQACCLFYLLLHCTFFKGKGVSEIFGDFVVFLYGGLKKRVIYFGWDQLREGNYGRLIDFLSQISQLSNFNLLDFADFMMDH